MTRFRLNSLRSRLLLLLILAFLPLFVLLLYTDSEEKHLAAREVEESTFQQLRPILLVYDQQIDEAQQLLLVLAHLPSVRAHNAHETSRLLADLLARNPAYANLGAIMPDGTVFASGIPFPGHVNLANHPDFQRVLRTRVFVIGAYQIGPFTHKAAINVAYPDLDENGRVRTIVFAALDLAWLNRLTARISLSRHAILFVLDEAGTVLVRSPNDLHRVGESLAGTALGKYILAQGTGVREASGDDHLELYAFLPLTENPQAPGGYVCLGVPLQMAFARTNALFVHNLLMLALVTFLALVAAWVGSNAFILRRIKALSCAAIRLGNGNLTARTGLPYRSDELGQLAQTFDNMADSLENADHRAQVTGRISVGILP